MSECEKCPRCSRPHVTPKDGPACAGHRSRNHPTDPGGPCANSPMHGQTVCHAHGGRAPQNRTAAKARQAEADAEKALRRFGEPVDTTPTEALLDAVKWTAGYVAWLREKVASITSDEKLVWGQTRNKVGGEDRGVTYEAGPNAWLVLLGTWHDRLVRICAEAIKAGVAERQVRLAEQQGALVADVIRKILGDLELTPAQQQRAGNVIPIRLRELAG